jgi:8-oxo-dGTP pyrophosphatase MutT (NUDIX family)
VSAPAAGAVPLAADWRARIRLALAANAGAASATASDDAQPAGQSGIVPAAVLVPIVLYPSPAILLTRRTDTLPAHAGQVSFPGGRIDARDADAAGAALRETEEEIGLPRHAVELAGGLPRHLTGTGYAIAPLVGLLRPPVMLTPDPREVAEVFELPLSTVLDPNAARREEAEFRGQLRRFWVIPHERHHIWGATAAILVNLGRVLRAGH